jgi:NADP-dependent 3-hydroxy acid dehydrogenase YdfG
MVAPPHRVPHPERRPAVVTGASSGIGAATAVALAAAGFPVALGARRTDRCEEVVRQIRDAGGEACAHRLDVSDGGSVDEFAQAVAEELGDVEVVVSNAAVLVPGRTDEVTTETFQRELEVNLVGVHRLVRAFVPGMVGRQRGDLVFVSSDVAHRPRPWMSAYTASKWGLEGMAHALQMELEGTGVRASIVRPGPTKSEMGSDWEGPAAETVITKWVEHGLARHPMLLRASAIADAITTVVNAPRGVHVHAIEVSPEAPLEEP